MSALKLVSKVKINFKIVIVIRNYYKSISNAACSYVSNDSTYTSEQLMHSTDS